MDLNYKLKENDYLQMLLYFAKEDGKLKKEIIRSTTIRVGFLLLMSVLAYNGINDPFSYLFPVGIVFCLIFLPNILKNYCFKSYQKHTKAYKAYFDKDMNLKIDTEYIYQIRVDVEIKNRISTIDKVIETGRYFYIVFPIGLAIIPKDELEDVNQIKQELLILSEKLKVNYKSDLDWKW